MSNGIRLAAVVAAVLVIAFVGINLISPKNGGIGGPAPTPTPTPTPRAMTVGTPRPAGARNLSHGRSIPVAGDLHDACWLGGEMGGPYAVYLDRASGSGTVAFLVFNKVYADPCHYDKGVLNPPPGPSVDDTRDCAGEHAGCRRHDANRRHRGWLPGEAADVDGTRQLRRLHARAGRKLPGLGASPWRDQ